MGATTSMGRGEGAFALRFEVTTSIDISKRDDDLPARGLLHRNVFDHSIVEGYTRPSCGCRIEN